MAAGVSAKGCLRMDDTDLSLGIDIGGTQIKFALVEPDGTLVDSRLEPTVDDSAALVEIVKQGADKMAASPSAVGISAPGLASADNRSIAWMRGRLQSVEGLNWSAQLDRHIWILNDGHAATVAEQWIGAARGKSHVIMLTLGTGVGGGVIINGALFQGAIGRAGHLGHISLNQDGPPDIVGMPGSLEDCIGNHNILQRTEGRFPSTFDLLEAVAAGDQQANEFWQQSVRGLALGIASLINSFDPELVVLGGGIAECGRPLFELLANYLDEYEWRPTEKGVSLVPATLGQLAGAIGAARFAYLKSQEKKSR